MPPTRRPKDGRIADSSASSPEHAPGTIKRNAGIIWGTNHGNRASEKRDLSQAEAVAELCTRHLGLAFDDKELQALPLAMRKAFRAPTKKSANRPSW